EAGRGVPGRAERVPGVRRDRDEVVLVDLVDAVADQAAAAPVQHEHRVAMLVPLERRMPARPDLEIAQLAGEIRLAKQQLAGDVAKRRAAGVLVRRDLDVLPAAGRGATADRR